MKKKPIKYFLISLIFVLMTFIFISTSSTLAYYKVLAEGADNSFKSTTIPDDAVSIKYNYSSSTKTLTNLYFDIKDVGFPIYLRIHLNINWRDSDGSDGFYMFPLNENEHYRYKRNTTDWNVISEEYYHIYAYNQIIDGKTTIDFINEFVSLKSSGHAGVVLGVEIIYQVIQAIGSTDDNNYQINGENRERNPFEDAWGWSNFPGTQWGFGPGAGWWLNNENYTVVLFN